MGAYAKIGVLTPQLPCAFHGNRGFPCGLSRELRLFGLLEVLTGGCGHRSDRADQPWQQEASPRDSASQGRCSEDRWTEPHKRLEHNTESPGSASGWTATSYFPGAHLRPGCHDFSNRK